MITGNYICPFCDKEYKPTKRGRQIYCSTQCCKKASYHKNKYKKVTNTLPRPSENLPKKEENIPSLEAEVITQEQPKKNKVEEISGPGIANVVIGTGLVEMAMAAGKAMLTPPENKPATQKDIQELKNLINKRYYKVISGVAIRSDSAIPYFDMETRSIVYFGGFKQDLSR